MNWATRRPDIPSLHLDLHIYCLTQGKMFHLSTVLSTRTCPRIRIYCTMQVSMYAEYNKGLLTIERIQLFLPTPFCKDRNTGHLIICFFFFGHLHNQGNWLCRNPCDIDAVLWFQSHMPGPNAFTRSWWQLWKPSFLLMVRSYFSLTC